MGKPKPFTDTFVMILASMVELRFHMVPIHVTLILDITPTLAMARHAHSITTKIRRVGRWCEREWSLVQRLETVFVAEVERTCRICTSR
jgi:hypothetical protein